MITKYRLGNKDIYDSLENTNEIMLISEIITTTFILLGIFSIIIQEIGHIFKDLFSLTGRKV